MSFDHHYDQTDLAHWQSRAKTLTRAETRFMAAHFERRRPDRAVEFGTQWGCSARAIVECARWCGIPDFTLTSYDIIDDWRGPALPEVTRILADMTDDVEAALEGAWFAYLDCHAAKLTRRVMRRCLLTGIDFGVHDVASVINLGPGYPKRPEMWLVGSILSPRLWLEDVAEGAFGDTTWRASVCRDGSGLLLVEVDAP